MTQNRWKQKLVEHSVLLVLVLRRFYRPGVQLASENNMENGGGGAGWTGPDHCVKAGLNLHKCTYLPFICEVAETEKDLFN